MAKKILLYGGKVKGKCIGAFIRDDFEFQIVKPGIDIQGRNRTRWTQIVWSGVPVWEMKLDVPLTAALEKFNILWEQYFKDKPDFALKVLESEKADRERHFQDGVKGEVVAPAPLDGANEGTRYPG